MPHTILFYKNYKKNYKNIVKKDRHEDSKLKQKKDILKHDF